jgi:class 3 adenylate cyclase
MRPAPQPPCLSLGQIRELGCRMARDLEVAILFADVVGSTQLYDKFGDTKASETVAVCLDAMKDATMQFDGTVIKTIGDEVMSTFPSVDQAMRAAVMMQSRISSDSRKEDTIPVSIRIGCHYGPVVQEQNDIFGAAVHTANRMTSQAKAKQIVISGETVSQMSPELKKQTRQIDVATVRGRLDEVALYELLWNPEEATSMLPTIEWENRKASRLTLSFRDQTVELDDKRKSVTLGRADDNDLVIKGNLISRIHAKIEMRRGKFVLIDQSTNGTFIENVQGEERFVRRDTTELHGEGVIGLGRVEKAGASLAVHFKTKE